MGKMSLPTMRMSNVRFLPHHPDFTYATLSCHCALFHDHRSPLLDLLRLMTYAEKNPKKKTIIKWKKNWGGKLAKLKAL